MKTLQPKLHLVAHPWGEPILCDAFQQHYCHINALKNRGMALIEADTDGVYFAVPNTWNEEQERKLVAKIEVELPEGIRLEYERRYTAMLSHEVKNYALLTYNGQLIVRGVALRSSWAEPWVRYYRTRNKKYVWLPDENEEASVDHGWESESITKATEGAVQDFHSHSTKLGDVLSPRAAIADRRDYDSNHYIQVLISSYAARLRKAFSSEDFEQLFRLESQPGLFDQPVENIQPKWIRCITNQT